MDYLANLSEARRRIAHDLIVKLVFESPPSLPPSRICPRDDVTIPDTDSEFVSSEAAGRIAARPELLPAGCSLVAVLPFPTSDTVLVVPVDRIQGYGRLNVTSAVTRLTPTSSGTIDHPFEILRLMDQEGAFRDPADAERYRDEVGQSVANLAFSMLAEPDLAGEVPDPADLLRSRPDHSEPPSDPTIPLERLAAIHGLPGKPTVKTSTGLTPVESLLYAPEFTDRIDLRFVAIHREHSLEVSTSSDPSPTEWAHTAFVGLDRALEESLPTGASTDEYTVLPVHPWQFDHTVADLRRREGLERIVPIDGYTQPATPLLNMRTVIPRGSAHGEFLPRIKLPLDICKMDVRRLLPPGEVYNGPQLTGLLESILSDGPFDGFGVLGEFAGACFQPAERSGGGGTEATTAEYLSAIYRVNPRAHPLVGEGDVPLTAACLLADHPERDEAIVRGLVERFASNRGFSGLADAVYAFLEHYAECVVPGPLRLMAGYGIGLEAHSQNTVVVFDQDARPRAALVRDFGGIRIDTSRLEASRYDVDLFPRSAVDADIQEMYELYYALFFRQLGDLIAVLVDEFDVDERACWRIVRGACEATFGALKDDPDVPSDHVEQDEAALFDWRTEGMAWLTETLSGRDERAYFSAPNPLAGNWPTVRTRPLSEAGSD